MTVQQAPFLRNQRQFPFDAVQNLSFEVDRTYIDIASKVNARTIGLYAVNFPVVTGEDWFLTGQSQKQQTLRQLYTGTGTGSFSHGIDISKITGFTRIYGTFLSGSNWDPLPYVDVTLLSNCVGLSVTPTDIVISSGTTVVGTWYVVLEWLSVF